MQVGSALRNTWQGGSLSRAQRGGQSQALVSSLQLYFYPASLPSCFPPTAQRVFLVREVWEEGLALMYLVSSDKNPF